jgi:hypothetical protein
VLIISNEIKQKEERDNFVDAVDNGLLATHSKVCASSVVYIVTFLVCHATNNFTPYWIQRNYCTFAPTVTQFTVTRLLPWAVPQLSPLLSATARLLMHSATS